MGKVTGGELIVRTLLQAGVEQIFSLHGAHIDTVYQACLDHDLPIVDMRHEAAAGHAAEGFARNSGKCGIALVTAGGGFTNALTPMANAYIDRTPVLFITASGALRDDETNTLQSGIDQVAVAAPITKWAHRVMRSEHIPRLIQQALRVATTGPRGPVLLDLPWDILTGEIDEAEVDLLEEKVSGRPAQPAAQDLEQILNMLASAKRPVIAIGGEAVRSNAGDALRSLAQTTGIPVFAEYEALSLTYQLPERLRGGAIQNLYSFESAGCAPDVILMLGLRFGLYTVHGSGRLLSKAARIFHIDPSPGELGRLQSIELGIVADVGGALAGLAAAAVKRVWNEEHAWAGQCRVLVDQRYSSVAAKADDAVPLHPFRASQIVAKHLNKKTTVVGDGALSFLWMSEVMGKADAAAFLCHGHFGSMGVGFGMAVGSAVADCATDGRTILVTGDGALGYSIAEFDTVVRKQLPLVVVVMNNRSWGATLHYQQLAVGENRITGTRLENGAYEDVARAFGADAYFVDTAEAFDKALGSALGSGRPSCINVAVRLDPSPPEELVLIGLDPFA